jgi:hypothetical protein
MPTKEATTDNLSVAGTATGPTAPVKYTAFGPSATVEEIEEFLNPWGRHYDTADIHAGVSGPNFHFWTPNPNEGDHVRWGMKSLPTRSGWSDTVGDAVAEGGVVLGFDAMSPPNCWYLARTSR